MLRSTPLIAILVLVSGTQAASAQRRAPGSRPAEEVTDIGITARLGSKSFSSKVSGTCKYEPSASIYNVPAALYQIEAQGPAKGEIKRLNLTLWQPKDGSADQVSLLLETGSRTSRIDVNPRSAATGNASLRIKPSGEGGSLELKGKDAKGTPLSLTIDCPTFSAVAAEGG
jgi:hypothetical protein